MKSSVKTRMTVKELLANATRNVADMFPGFSWANAFGQNKRNYAKDFGWPDHLNFNNYHYMYSRNGMAKAAVTKTVRKTWEDNPVLQKDSSTTEQSPVENRVAKHFKAKRIWQKLAEADRRSMVGGYSALIFRIGDGRDFDQPVGDIAGISSLVDVIVAWSPQLQVSKWDTRKNSPTYGEPLMYQFREAAIPTEGDRAAPKYRNFDVHPDRVMIWSKDGSVHCPSALEAGYNDLIDMEKIKGAGGEGFWKNAKNAPVLEVDKEASLRELASSMGVEEEDIFEAMDEQVANYSKGFDNLLMLQGIQAKPLNIQMASPENFFMVALQHFAASVEIPLKVLVGTQTGERASSEDAREWAQTINARRNDEVFPLVVAFVLRLIDIGVLMGEWDVTWTDLTQATMQEKLELAAKMANINNKTDVKKEGEKVFTKIEIREAVGYSPQPAEDPSSMDGQTDDQQTQDEPEQSPESERSTGPN